MPRPARASARLLGAALLTLACAAASGCPARARPAPATAASDARIATSPGAPITPTTPAAARGDRPDIVLVTIDALRADHVSALGYGRPTTPNLARFAARGAVFTAAHANGGWTLPGIGSLLTGLRPPAHRIDGPSFTIPAALRALPAILKEHGYRVPGFLDWYQERGFGFEAVESPYRMPYVGEARAKSELALRWLDEHRGEPSFVWLHQVVVHLPYEPSAESVALFADPASESDPAAAGFDGSRAMAIDLASGARTATAAGAARVAARYDACVRDADAALGVLLDGLDARDAWSHTIVIVTADHGDELLDRGRAGHAWWTYHGSLHEEILHVPLFVWAPGVAPRTVDTLVEQADVAPTLLELAGLGAPEVAAPEAFEGRSLAPLLAGRPLPPRPAFAESTPAGFYVEPEILGDLRLRSVIDGPWKLLVSQGALGVKKELFRLDRDPGEHHDLAATEPAQVERLTRLLGDWLLDARRRSFALRRATLRPGAEAPLGAILDSRQWLDP